VQTLGGRGGGSFRLAHTHHVSTGTHIPTGTHTVFLGADSGRVRRGARSIWHTHTLSRPAHTCRPAHTIFLGAGSADVQRGGSPVGTHTLCVNWHARTDRHTRDISGCRVWESAKGGFSDRHAHTLIRPAHTGEWRKCFYSNQNAFRLFPTSHATPLNFGRRGGWVVNGALGAWSLPQRCIVCSSFEGLRDHPLSDRTDVVSDPICHLTSLHIVNVVVLNEGKAAVD
jgi:hypothetical protein